MTASLSNDQLVSSIRQLVREERRLTTDILNHITEVEKRRLYADLGSPSVFE